MAKDKAGVQQLLDDAHPFRDEKPFPGAVLSLLQRLDTTCVRPAQHARLTGTALAPSAAVANTIPEELTP